MEVTAKVIAGILQGEIIGNPEVKINKPAGIENADSGSISFLGDMKYEAHLYSTRASIVLINKEFVPKEPVLPTLIKVSDVYKAVAILLNHFDQKEVVSEIQEPSFIDSTVKLGENIFIGRFANIEKGAKIGDNTLIQPQVFIGKGVEIGKNCVLYSGVKIYNGCKIGDNCILHANTVIGSDGFGFAPQADGSYKKIPQLGIVILENNVEMGANCAIDRAAMDATIIREGVKIDNLVHIAHNVEVKKNTVLAGQVGIAGSTVIGENCIFGGQVGVAGHIKIANGTQVQGQSGISSSIKEENTKLYGSPSLSYRNYLRSYAVFKNLPELARKIDKLLK